MPNVSALLSGVCAFVPVRILSSLHGGAGLRQSFPALFCVFQKKNNKKTTLLKNKEKKKTSQPVTTKNQPKKL